MPEEIRCEVFRITWPDWSSISKECQEQIWEVIEHGVSEGEPPSRMGLVGTSRHEDVVAGFFACEDLRTGVQYDGDWRKQQQEGAEFEHLFFALILEPGQIVLQRKRIDRDFVTINLPEMRRKFFRLIGKVLKSAGCPSDQIRVKPFREERSKEDLIEVFKSHQVTYVRVKGLLGRHVPDSVKLFNPNIDQDLILKQILNGDYNHLDEFEASTSENAQGGNLREAKIVKAAMLTGEPQEVRAKVSDQERTFRLSQREKFDMQLETAPGEDVKDSDVERLIRIVRTEYFIPSSALPGPSSLGPLFDWGGNENDRKN